MPEESTIENKLPERSGLTPGETAKAKRIFNKSSEIGSGGRVMEPESTKTDVLKSMGHALNEAVESGDADKSGAIRRNIKTIREELGIKPKG